MLECATDASLSPLLPHARRRVIIGQRDHLFGDVMDLSEPGPSDPILVPLNASLVAERGALAQCRIATGLDCGNATVCFEGGDGGGYATPDMLHTNPFSPLMDGSRSLPWGVPGNVDFLARTARLPAPPRPPSATISTSSSAATDIDAFGSGLVSNSHAKK